MTLITLEYISALETRFARLASDFRDLSGFNQVAEFDSQATSLIIELKMKKIELEKTESFLLQDSRDAVFEHDQLPFMKKIFTPIARVNENKISTNNIHKMIPTIDDCVEKLYMMIELTPNNPDEKKNHLEQYRTAKKELQILKREIAQNLREIRSQARTKLSVIGSGGPKIIRTLNAIQRSSIRSQKESEISSQEVTKEEIDCQILRIDKEILRISKIK